ncbi:cathepsin D-like [Amphibalanus amphitrite]|uniref:cathepsin D-like n=1 Tax=Amphibalanus amphitrite TaxID=1232801 RepID=UPI001C9131D6|nr:cathepsin D-like [Amphibalanus amphitrite]
MLRVLLALACLGALQAAAVPDTTGYSVISLPLKDVLVNGQQSFVGVIGIGTPDQSMTVTVDISSRLTYVPSVNCSDPFCTGHRRYDSAASSTYEADGTPFELPYGQNASGVLSKDSISVAGATVHGQTFGEATAVWNSYSVQAPNDGVLGLGFSLQPDRVPSILDTMKSQDLIGRRLVGLWLGRDGAGGELSLGGLNSARYSGELVWATTLQNPDGWVVMTESFDVGETSLCTGNCLVNANSLNPYFFMSMEMAKTVNDAIGGIDIGQPGVVALNCTSVSTLPSLKMTIAGRSLEMSPLEYVFVIPLEGGAEMCISGFVGVPQFIDNYVSLGTMFMQKFYTAFDAENLRMGFADST